MADHIIKSLSTLGQRSIEGAEITDGIDNAPLSSSCHCFQMVNLPDVPCLHLFESKVQLQTFGEAPEHGSHVVGHVDRV